MRVLVVRDGVPELVFRLWMKSEIHVANCRPSLAKTSSPGIALTRPDRRSSNLDFATTAHFRSISRSGGFRVRNNESTMKVLSSTGKDSTSCMISMAVGIIHLARLWANRSIAVCLCSTRENSKCRLLYNPNDALAPPRPYVFASNISRSHARRTRCGAPTPRQHSYLSGLDGVSRSPNLF